MEFESRVILQFLYEQFLGAFNTRFLNDPGVIYTVSARDFQYELFAMSFFSLSTS